MQSQSFVARSLRFSYRKQNWDWRQMCVEVHCSLHQILSEEAFCKRQHNPWEQDVKVLPYMYKQKIMDFPCIPLILGNNKPSWNDLK